MAIPNVDGAIYTKLTGASGVTAIASTRIYNGFVPSSTARPYVLFYHAAGGDMNTSPRDSIEDVYRVEAVGQTQASASTLASAIHDALHEQTLTVSGWSNYWMVSEAKIFLVDEVDGDMYFRQIRQYRIKISKDG